MRSAQMDRYKRIVYRNTWSCGSLVVGVVVVVVGLVVNVHEE